MSPASRMRSSEKPARVAPIESKLTSLIGNGSEP